MAATRILVVEDDAQIRDTLRELLEAEGYDAHGAEHGAHALELLGDGLAPDIILLDLMMPVMNGSEFRAKQLADPALAAIPVIVVSAFPIAGLHGPVLYLQKPIRLAQLLATIQSALHGDDPPS
jgi:CheY-like chemotaxis protein